MRALIHVLTAPLLIQISPYGLEKQRMVTRAWPCSLRTPIGGLKEAPGSQFWIRPALAVSATWGVDWHMEISLFVSLFYKIFFYSNKNK